MSFSRKVVRGASIVLALAALSWSPATLAGYAEGRIAEIQSYGSHSGILIYLVEGFPNTDGCTGVTWLIYPDTSRRVEYIQAILLTQLKSGGRIKIWTSGCFENYPQIVHVSIRE